MSAKLSILIFVVVFAAMAHGVTVAYLWMHGMKEPDWASWGWRIAAIYVVVSFLVAHTVCNILSLMGHPRP